MVCHRDVLSRDAVQESLAASNVPLGHILHFILAGHQDQVFGILLAVDAEYCGGGGGRRRRGGKGAGGKLLGSEKNIYRVQGKGEGRKDVVAHFPNITKTFPSWWERSTMYLVSVKTHRR